ncbi:MFS transporter [Conexibacter sp. CPCC 206217]|uniref:MFS transporter n=1 Tax=Conexibacter sp. CPCC 206217 TaxID=3064574 RepID=UPI002726B936|nr:MFS transporter [Conexibacter sp. CPCC 206217]MDO8211240.1 MFS transporter [Conexibacter sp. CPCC 206217]
MPPASSTTTVAAPRRLTGTPAFALVAAVIGLALAASATPTPLYGVYQQEWGFSTITLTLVYAVYTVGVLAALLVAGSISDQVGRRPVLFAALTGLIASTVVFAFADSVAWLFAARLVQGLFTGVALGAAGAAMIDLHPRADHRRVGLVNGTVSAAGLGVGSIVSAALVQYGPAPEVLPYVLLGVLFAAALTATFFLPEPIRERSRLALHLQRPQIPPAVRGAFLLSSLAVLASWSIGGIYLSIGPRLASEMLDTQNHLAGGLAILALTLPAVLTQLRFHALDPHTAASAGAATLGVGMALIVASLSTGSAVFFLAASAVAGAGWGAAFLGALRSLTAVIPPQHRAEVMSAFYVVAYLSLGVPAIVAGVVATHLSLDDTFRIFGALVVVLAATVSVLAARVRTTTRAAAVTA